MKQLLAYLFRTAGQKFLQSHIQKHTQKHTNKIIAYLENLMFGLSNEDVLGLLNTFMKAQPIAALRIVLRTDNVWSHLNKCLTKEELQWLVKDINDRPKGMVDFINSETGKQLTKEILQVYYRTVTPQREMPAPQSPPAVPAGFEITGN